MKTIKLTQLVKRFNFIIMSCQSNNTIRQNPKKHNVNIVTDRENESRRHPGY